MVDRADGTETLMCHVCLTDIELAPDGRFAVHKELSGARCDMSKQLPYLWEEAGCRPTVASRSGGLCEVRCGRRATEMHHRITRGAGGGWSPANILHLCHDHHAWATTHPTLAQNRGWSVRSTDQPAQIPVRPVTGEPFFLSDDILPPRSSRRRRR